MQVLYEKNTKKKKGHEQCWLFAGKQMKNILRINCHGVSTFLEYLYFRIQLRFFLQDLAFFNFLWLNIFQQKLWFFHKFIFNFKKKKIKIPLFFFCHPLSPFTPTGSKSSPHCSQGPCPSTSGPPYASSSMTASETQPSAASHCVEASTPSWTDPPCPRPSSSKSDGPHKRQGASSLALVASSGRTVAVAPVSLSSSQVDSITLLLFIFSRNIRRGSGLVFVFAFLWQMDPGYQSWPSYSSPSIMSMQLRAISNNHIRTINHQALAMASSSANL